MQIGERVDRADARARAISTLGNRIGFDHVLRFGPHESHLPERSFVATLAVNRQTNPVWKRPKRTRPIRLYTPPEYLRVTEAGRPPIRFEWRRKSYQTVVAKGPERLTAEWWCAGDMRTRDYWRVETEEGARLWLLTYPGAEPPYWYVAGLFP
jgi:protein ImuB